MSKTREFNTYHSPVVRDSRMTYDSLSLQQSWFDFLNRNKLKLKATILS